MDMIISAERDRPSVVTWIVGFLALALLLLFLDLRDEVSNGSVFAAAQAAPAVVAIPSLPGRTR